MHYARIRISNTDSVFKNSEHTHSLAGYNKLTNDDDDDDDDDELMLKYSGKY